MDTATHPDDERLWARVQDALDNRRDPWDDAELADGLAARPELAAELMRLTERLDLLTLAADPEADVVGVQSATPGAAQDALPGAAPAATHATSRARPLVLLPALAVAAVVLLALRLVLHGDGPHREPAAVSPRGPALVAALAPDHEAQGARAPDAGSRSAVRVLGWSVRVIEHRPGLELRRERSPGRVSLTARDHRGAVAITTLRSLR